MFDRRVDRMFDAVRELPCGARALTMVSTSADFLATQWGTLCTRPKSGEGSPKETYPPGFAARRRCRRCPPLVEKQARPRSFAPEPMRTRPELEVTIEHQAANALVYEEDFNSDSTERVSTSSPLSVSMNVQMAPALQTPTVGDRRVSSTPFGPTPL